MAAPVAYYALLTSSAVFALTAVPQLIKPWTWGVAMYLPLKLTDDAVTKKQMTTLSWMFAMCVEFLCTVIVIGAVTNLTFPFVAVALAFFTIQIVTFIPKAMDVDTYGFDQKMIMPQIGMMVIFAGCLMYSLIEENLTTEYVALTLQAKILIGFNGFLIFANFMGIFVPEMLVDAYAPGYPPKDRYAKAQLALFLQGLSIFNTIVPSLGIVYLLTSTDYGLFLAISLPFYFVFTAIFIYFLSTAVELGWEPRAMYFWIAYNNIATGATLMLTLDAYGLFE